MGSSSDKPSRKQGKNNRPRGLFGRGAEMMKTVERGSGIPSSAIALFVIGVGLLFFFPAGTAIGVLLIGAALVLGYPRKKAWHCDKCGFEHV